MALLPDSSKIHLVLEQFSSSTPESGFDFLKDIFPVLPGILWVVFAFFFLHRFRVPLIDLLSKVDGFEFQGVKLSFLEDSLNEVVNLAKQKNRHLEMAAKDRKWNVSMSEDEKERALRRALANRKLLAGARLLWVDDQPENDNNERRMFQQLGVYCDFAQTTTSALEYLNEFEYDCIISDMDRQRVGESEMAGIELIWALKPKGISLPVILYVGNYDDSLPTPAGALGITNRPDQLLNLLLDALERTRR